MALPALLLKFVPVGSVAKLVVGAGLALVLAVSLSAGWFDPLGFLPPLPDVSGLLDGLPGFDSLPSLPSLPSIDDLLSGLPGF